MRAPAGRCRRWSASISSSDPLEMRATRQPGGDDVAVVAQPLGRARPACGATIACSSRLVRTVPSRVPRATSPPSVDALGAGEDALGRRDHDAEVGRVLALAVLRPAVDQRAGLVEVVRRLDREQFDAGQLALGDAGQRAGRAPVRSAALTPRSRAGAAGTGPSAPAGSPGATSRSISSAPVGHRGAVGVGQQDRAAGRPASAAVDVVGAARPRPAPCSGCGTRRRPAAAAPARRPAARRPASRARRGRRRRRSGRRRCGWPASSPAASMPATTSSGSPPSTRGHAGRGQRAGGGHLGAAARGEARPRSAGDERAGDRGGGELADAVAGDDPLGAVRRGRAAPATIDAERDDQRLGDRGVLDLVGVGGGAQPEQVEPGQLAELRRPARRRRAAPATGRACRGSATPWPGAKMAITSSTLP